MASTLYKTIFKKGKAEGVAEGVAKGVAKSLVNLLVRRLGPLDPAVRERIHKMSDLDALEVWFGEAADADVDAARRLVDKIRNAPLVEAPAP